jgi:hypothetical protein
LLLYNKFLYFYSTIINLKKNKIIISTYKNLIALIIIYYKNKYIIYKVLIIKIITISLKSIITISLIYILLLKKYSYIFKASYNSTYNTIIEYINFIIVINSSNKVKKILVKTRLKIIIKFKEKGYYLV